MEELDEILRENKRRLRFGVRRYDPERGIGGYGRRVRYKMKDCDVYIPKGMTEDPEFNAAKRGKRKFEMLRFRYDFEYWAVKCAKIKDKSSGKVVPFVLNYPQRKLLKELEDDRRQKKPCRIIMLKARQWGGSTLVQIYMAWLQIIQSKGLNSLICSHVKDSAAMIRGMYSLLLDRYPKEYMTGGKRLEFKPFESSRNTRRIWERECNVTIGSSESQDAVRGGDYAMAHLSEVGYWRDTEQSSPEDMVRSVCGAINTTAGTLIVMESTANGVGNYFHREWLRAKKGESDKKAIFVPWYEIEIYRKKVSSVAKLWESMTEYERNLWKVYGLTLQQIQWYHDKSREYISTEQMQAEYPTNDIEAFANSGRNVFAREKVEVLRGDCREPIAIGEVVGKSHKGKDALREVRFEEMSNGNMKIWSMPSNPRKYTYKYVVSVDIGGRSESSDWSVITVFDRGGLAHGGKIEVAAEWRGHADHDIIAWKSATIAKYYHNALLVIESNTLECENEGGEQGQSILNELYDNYNHLYYREVIEGLPKLGFHTNRSSKAMIVTRLIGLIRDGEYIERNNAACDELAVYEQNGLSYSASEGNHDDMVMTRAIGLFVATELGLDVSDYSVFK